MRFLHNNPELAVFSLESQKSDIVKKAAVGLTTKPVHITDSVSPMSAGGRRDYFSQADYFWPNPDSADGIPYIRRDGESNPDVFTYHRKALRLMRTTVANLMAAFLVTKKPEYAKTAARWLKEFFLDAETGMSPELPYAQAILGVCTGRGIGIIDTLHLIDVPVAVDILWENRVLGEAVYQGLREWFSRYLNWLCTHGYGIDEMNAANNHGICWHVQAAAFARFTENGEILKLCSENYKKKILPGQMAEDGSLPLELDRTKPYGYSIFTVDNLATLCWLLSTSEDNLWEFTLPDGRGMKKGLDYLYPFLDDKTLWPHKRDIAHYGDWPVAMSFMLFAAASYGEEKWARLYGRLDKFSQNEEVRRNTAIRVPYLWMV